MKYLVLLTIFFAQFAAAQVKMREKIILTSNNTVTFRGEVDDGSVTKAEFDLVKAVIARKSEKEPIYLVIDSPGGSIDSGLNFIEFAKTIPNLHTISIFSASMASAMVEALPGQRLITNNGWLMFHRARGGFQGQFEDGEVESRLNMAKRLVRSMEQANAGRMLMTLDVYKAKVKDELWLDAEQSIEARAADKIVDIYCSRDLIDARKKMSISLLFFRAEVIFSNCPLLRSPTTDAQNVYQVPSMTNINKVWQKLGIENF